MLPVPSLDILLGSSTLHAFCRVISKRCPWALYFRDAFLRIAPTPENGLELAPVVVGKTFTFWLMYSSLSGTFDLDHLVL